MIRAIQIDNNPNITKSGIKGDQNNCGEKIEELIKLLLKNDISITGIEELRGHIKTENFNAGHLSHIIQKIYDLNDLYIFEISVVEGTMKKLNEFKNKWRNKTFSRKIRNGFRKEDYPDNKVILAEGDSWFNYPIILTDIIDRLIMEKKNAVYSIAASGDWLLNMLAKRQYIEELSVIHPDWFIISGGGNDLVGSRRLAAIITEKANDEYGKNEWVKSLVDKADNQCINWNEKVFYKGVQYLSYDFFALLMFFHLQYYFMLYKILRPEGQNKFGPMKIITQGYDYVIPGDHINLGLKPWTWYKPFLRLLGHGKWLKHPMQIRGIYDPEVQQAVLYSMIYLFNEVIIETGHILNLELMKENGDTDMRVFHVDSRGAIESNGWTDELHPDVESFKKISRAFIDCIKGGASTYKHVFVVNKQNP